MLRSLALAAAAASSVVNAQGAWTLKLLNSANTPRAACLDGTMPGYYISPSPTGSKNWVIHTQGGGWCVSPQDCLGRSQTALGSSSSWGAAGCPNSSSPVCTADGGAAGMLSNNSATNPLLWDANKVFVAYCDGTSYASDLEAPMNVSGTNVYFRGKANLEGVFDALLGVNGYPGEGLATASRAIYKGCSAGGLAVYIHADRVGDRIRAVNPTVDYAAAPGAGFFMDVPGFDKTYHYRGNYQWVFNTANLTGAVNQACIAAFPNPSDQWQCFVAAYTLPFISTRLFISNALPDAWQAGNIMDLPCSPGGCGGNATLEAEVEAYLHVFRLQMISALAPVISSQRHGGFLQSCFVHVVEDVDGSWANVKIGGQSQAQTFAAWWNGPTAGASRIEVDGDWGTNPTC